MVRYTLICLTALLLASCTAWRDPLFPEHPVPDAELTFLNGTWIDDDMGWVFAIPKADESKVMTIITDESKAFQIGFTVTRWREQTYINIDARTARAINEQSDDKKHRDIKSKPRYFVFAIDRLTAGKIRVSTIELVDRDALIRRGKLVETCTRMFMRILCKPHERDDENSGILIDLRGMSRTEREGLRLRKVQGTELRRLAASPK